MQTNKNFFVPEYIQDFKCIGKDCIDSCCVGWKINIYCPKKRNKHISWESNEQKIKYTGENYFNKLKEIPNVNIHYIDTDLLPFKFKDNLDIHSAIYKKTQNKELIEAQILKLILFVGQNPCLTFDQFHLELSNLLLIGLTFYVLCDH